MQPPSHSSHRASVIDPYFAFWETNNGKGAPKQLIRLAVGCIDCILRGPNGGEWRPSSPPVTSMLHIAVAEAVEGAPKLLHFVEPPAVARGCVWFEPKMPMQ